MSDTKATLKAVADMAGVSISTASMILSQKQGVSFSQETVSKVLKAAQQVEYRPTIKLSASPVSLTKNTIGIISPNCSGPYYASIIQAVERAASARNYSTLNFNTYRDPQRELHGIETFLSIGVMGAIFTFNPIQHEFLKKVERMLPVVTIGDKNSVFKLDTVETDNYDAAALLVKHLSDLGHRNIAYLTTIADWWGYPSAFRLKAVQSIVSKEFKQINLKVISCPAHSPNPQMDNLMVNLSQGYQMGLECLKHPSVTGIIATSDIVAYGIMNAILESGYSIPGDYSICAFNNSFPSTLSAVSLTSVEQFPCEKGNSAFDLLYRKIKKQDSAECTGVMRMEYPCKLIVRDSTNVPRQT